MPERVPELINEHTLVLMPSREEPFGLVALQAAWMSRPVVATRVGGLPEVVAHRETGFLVETEDAASLADAAAHLLSEPRLAEKVPVISTAAAFRYEADVPIFLPAVNLEHTGLIDVQRKKRGWKGFITPGPNCTTVGLVISLAPLREAFGLKQVVMTSMQSVSGAGRSPGERKRNWWMPCWSWRRRIAGSFGSSPPALTWLLLPASW